MFVKIAIKFEIISLSVARQKYMEITKNEVFQCGLVVNPDMSWLFGSPDGLFLNDQNELSVLEIKCPISNEDQKITVPYLDFEIKKGHRRWQLDLKNSQGRKYYSQVQINMFLCGAKSCDFFVWTSVDYRLFSVQFEKTYV